jgi:hypothetical protein
MSKQTGIGAAVTVDDAGGTARTFSAAVTSFTTNQSRNQIDVTGVDKDFFERLPGLGDWSIGLTGVVDLAANGQHSVFASMGTALRTVLIVLGTLGGTVTGEAALQDYNINRAEGGALTWTATLNCSQGTALAWT